MVYICKNRIIFETVKSKIEANKNNSTATTAHLQLLNWLNNFNNSRCTKGLSVLTNRSDERRELVHSETSDSNKGLCLAQYLY